MSETRIHPTSLVADGAILGEGVVLGPGAVIGPKVTLADRVQVGAYTIIEGRATVGEGTRIAAHGVLGSAPQDFSYTDEDTALVIGANNDIREYVSISRGTLKGGGVTRLGDGNMLMAYSHIGHDVQLGNRCVITNGAQLAGHGQVGNHVVFGGLSGIHQFTRVGDLAMLAAGAMVTQDVLPFCLVQGDRARPVGLNRVGLQRHGGFALKPIRQMYRLLYQAGLGLEAALGAIEAQVVAGPERSLWVDFIRASQRGICR